MRICWRTVHSQRNSFSALYAACEQHGIILEPVDRPEGDILLYSLNSIGAGQLIDEMAGFSGITIAGGPHASACYEDVSMVADYVVVGEGEFTVPRLITAILNGTEIPPGVAGKGRYKPVDHTVIPDSYPSFSTVRGYIEISRGCPFQCAYCQTPRLFGSCMRHRSVSSIRELAKRMNQVRVLTPNALAWGSRGITPDLDKIASLLSGIRTSDEQEIFFGTFPSEVRPESVSEAAVALIMKYCANDRLHIGVQSGSDTVLSRIRRGHTVDDAWKAIDYCQDAGLIPTVDIIVGLPGETAEEQMETVLFIREVSRVGTVHAHRFIPLPGTPLAGEEGTPLIDEVRYELGLLARKGSVTGSWDDPEIRFFRRIPK